MLYFERGSPTDKLSPEDLRQGIFTALERLGVRKRVLIIPPDFTRLHSRAGRLTRLAYDFYGAARDGHPARPRHALADDVRADP
jgi:hypothetical protein